MRRSGVISLAATAVVAVVLAVPAASFAGPPPCPPVATSYDTGGAPTASVPNDPLLSRQWGLTQIKARGAWAHGAFGAGSTIAIVDTGVDLNHPDLKANLLPGVDLVSGEACTPGAQDLNGHGTHVAGIAAAVANNGIGVAGTAPEAKILPVRVLDADGSGTGSDIVAGIKWAADHGAQVINLSMGEGFEDPLGLGVSVSSPVDLAQLASGVDYAWQRGAVVVAAAGNSTFPLCEYPAADAHAICVAATDSSGLPSSYSNFPLRLDGGVALRAPGGDGSGSCDATSDIWSTYWPGASGVMAEHCDPKGYEPLAGTSMATPFVSGVAAMLRGAGLSNQQVLDCLAKTSSNGGSYDPVWGYGIVNAEAAVTGCTHLTAGATTFARRSLRITISIPKGKARHVARAGYVAARVRVSAKARVRLQVRSGHGTKAASSRAAVLASGSRRLAGARTYNLRLRLTPRGRRIVRRHRSLAVTLFGYAQDAADDSGTAAVAARIHR